MRTGTSAVEAETFVVLLFSRSCLSLESRRLLLNPSLKGARWDLETGIGGSYLWGRNQEDAIGSTWGEEAPVTQGRHRGACVRIVSF